MNRVFKKHLWLTAMVISITAPAAYADDLFGDSFFADPAPVDAVKPADPTPAPEPAAEPVQAATEPAEPSPATKEVADVALPAEPAFPKPEEPQLSMDFPMPPADNIPSPSNNVMPAQPSIPDFNFAAPGTGTMNLASPPSEQVLGKISSDVFREMAEMERENNALMLQLKREQLRSEIDALKTSNRQILFDEIERREKMTQARLEWELAQDLKRQEALERKRKAEIRQKQIEAALKREEERRIQRMKEEEERRIQKQKEEKAEADRKKDELRKKYDAASLVQVKGLQPVFMAATRPAKVKRSATSRVALQLTPAGQEMLTKKKAGESLAAEMDSEKENEAKKNREPASSLYTVAEIRGTAGTLIAKLISKKDRTTFFAKQSTILPTGHTVINIDKDYVLVQIGKDKEMIGFPSAGLLSENATSPSAVERTDSGDEGAENNRPAARQKRISAPISLKSNSGPLLSGAALAK